jgi:hypothetical protein
MGWLLGGTGTEALGISVREVDGGVLSTVAEELDAIAVAAGGAWSQVEASAVSAADQIRPGGGSILTRREVPLVDGVGIAIEPVRHG